MSYTALYRKFRPDTFEEVKGQDHIVTALRNQIKADRIGHAYLFCGTRGTGKTTTAKILAKAVNCEHPVDGDPCNECASCRAIAAGTSMNVIEIDAASNNGVDNIREIREETAYSPSTGKYKVYIIDEVHMLSIGAFNALLKTLEEPPSYVIFILATTEAHKIPVTILSRCQRYDFKRISQEEITGRLEDLLQREGVEAEEKAIRYIARKADGGMRDALSLAEQCISFYMGQKLTYENILEVLGAVDTEVFSRLLREIVSKNVGQVFAQLEELIMQGRDLSQFVNDFIWYLRNLMLLKASEEMEETLDVSAENLKALLEEAGMVREDTLMRYIRIFSELSNQMRYAVNKRVLLEVALIKLCRPEMEKDQISVLERLRRLEKKLENGVVVQGSVAAETGSRLPETRLEAMPSGMQAADLPQKNEAEKLHYAKAVPEDLKTIRKLWPGIVSGAKSPRFRQVLSSAELNFNPVENGEHLLYVVFRDFMGEPYTANQECKTEIEQLIAEKTGKMTNVRFMLSDDVAGSGVILQTVDVEQAMKDHIHMDIEYED